MKKIKFILIIFIGIAFTLSCDEDKGLIGEIESGSNLAGFEEAVMAITQIADGSEYPVEVLMKVFGPSYPDLTGDVTVNVAASESSTAIAGKHYRLDDTSIKLSKSNNFLGKLHITMLTDGIETPLDESPVLVLEATQATGNADIAKSGKPVSITLNYACPSDLQGSYTCTMVRDGGAAVTYTDEITKTGVGTYRTTEVGHWIGGLGVGTPGYTFTDVCGVINVPQQDLVEFYGNQVQSTAPGSVDPDTGVLTIVYSITSAGWSSVYECTYVPN